MDFTTTKNKLDFTVDGAKFYTKNAIAAGVIFKLQGTFSKLGNKKEDAAAGAERAEAYEELKRVYVKILTKDAWKRFEPLIEGTCDDKLTPIDMLKLIEITQWLIGEGLGKDHMPPQDS
jgi:hypothetical protein